MAVPGLYYANADASIAPKNEAPGSLTLENRGVALPDFTALVERVKPAVVSVRVKETGSAGMVQNESGNPFEGTPLEQFFKNFRNRGDSGQWQWRFQMKPTEAQGSGFFISADGYLVTNNHVVNNAAKVEIVTDDRRTLEASVVGVDAKSDLALLKADASGPFPFVTLAKEEPKIGEWVVAMGNPFGLGGTVTTGIVSARGRDIGEGPYDNFLQIDAPINRGNSGGPTFNLKGEVIGVNTAIYSPSGGSVGIAFAIPSTTVTQVIGQLQSKGYVERGWLGVQVQALTPEIAEGLGAKSAAGALVSASQSGSPAEKAGIQTGDVITEVNGTEVKDARDLAQKIAAISPGSEVTLKVLRDGKSETMTVKVGRLEEKMNRPAVADQSGATTDQKLGLALAPASEVDGPGSQGVAVVGVDPNGKAAELGLTQGDLILKVNGKPLSKPQDFADALKAAKDQGRKHAVLLVRHNANELFVAVPVAVG